MNSPKRQRRDKSYRGCTHCRESRKKCSEERPCSYCVKTGHASSCEYNGLEALIRFDKNSIAHAQPTISRRKPQKKDQLCPSKDTSTDPISISLPSTPSADSTPSATATPPPSIPKWILSNGTGFETRDVPFIRYFLDRFPTDKWFARLAEPVASYMMANALDAPVLHHATMSVSALLASRDLLEQPAPVHVCIERYFEHKQKALQLARHHLETDDISGSLAVAVAFFLITEKGNPETRRVHMLGLKSVLQHLQAKLSDEEKNDLPPTLPALYWLSWSIGIRFDIGQATIEGNPILDPLPLTADYESRSRSWIVRMCGPTMHPDGIEFAVLVCTLRMFLHRAFHLASTARKYRTSPGYSPIHEAKIQRLCCKLERDLDDWMSRRLMRPSLFETEFPRDYDAISFLHYPPLPIPKSHGQSLMMEYHMAKLYVSFISIPEVGPGPPESGRFQNALEICRNLAAVKIDPRWSHLAEYTRLFQLFLCCLAFGGTDYYPEESRGAVQMILMATATEGTGMSVEELFDRWIKHCPGLPPISWEKFPWISAGDRSRLCGRTHFDP